MSARFDREELIINRYSAVLISKPDNEKSRAGRRKHLR